MNILWGFLVVLAATAAGVTALLVVRRGAPDGGYFHDGDRAAGVFGVLATGFSVLLGFHPTAALITAQGFLLF